MGSEWIDAEVLSSFTRILGSDTMTSTVNDLNVVETYDDNSSHDVLLK